jgi:hypothetical protein
MKTYSRLGASDLTRQLVTGGFLAGEAQDAAFIHPAPPGLLISQDVDMMASSAFDLDCCPGTGYNLFLHIAVDLPRFAIWEWMLDLPWKDPQIQWLPDPTGHTFPNNMYQFPGCPDLKFPRDEVINHRRMIRRGRPLDGMLLGYGFESIPDSYRHGANIDASLVLIDEMGRGFSTPVKLWINRRAKIDRKRTKKTTRGRLFENRDRSESELVKK